MDSMAYQLFDGGRNEGRVQYDDYERTDRASYQQARFVDPYDRHNYPNSAPRYEQHQDNAAYDHDTRARYSNMSQERYHNHSNGQAPFNQEGYTSSYSDSDYITPPARSTHDHDYDHILPHLVTAQRYPDRRRARSEKKEYHDELSSRTYLEPYQNDYRHVHQTIRPHSEFRTTSRADAIKDSNHHPHKMPLFNTSHDFMPAYGIKPSNPNADFEANDILKSFRHVDRRKQAERDWEREQRAHGMKSRSLDAYDEANRFRDLSRHVDRRTQAEREWEREQSLRYRIPVRKREEGGSDSDTGTCLDSDVPARGESSDSDMDMGIGIGSFKSSTSSSPKKYWSRSPSTSPCIHRRYSSETGAGPGMWRSVSRSALRRRKGSEKEREEQVFNIDSDSDSDQDRPRGRYMSSSSLPLPRRRRYSSTSSRRHRSRSRSRVLSSRSSILSYRSEKSNSIFGGSEFEVGVGRLGSVFASGESGSEISGSESGSEIESMDDFDEDDYLDDGWDEQIEDDLEFHDY